MQSRTSYFVLRTTYYWLMLPDPDQTPRISQGPEYVSQGCGTMGMEGGGQEREREEDG